MSREPALRCYRCGNPATPEDAKCRSCGFPLDWGAIGDLRSLDYLKLRLEQWRRQGALDRDTAERLLAEVTANHAKLLETLEPAAPPQFARPEPRSEPAVAAPVRGLRPKYVLPAAVLEPPRFRPSGPPPPRRPQQPPPPPPPPRPPRRPLLDVLVDIGTVRLILYTGALLVAVSVTIWLRDVLRVQLQRPIVQAGLLGIATFAVLAAGIALVQRAKDREEQRLIGRGVLFLGTLLLPLNPWFWVQTGLVVDRGNAWTVTLVTFGVALGIALALGDRVFVYMSYVAALLTGWLLTFKITGGTAPGAYAIVLSLVSGAYLHAELPVARAGERRNWERLGLAFFLCGQIGIALTLVFYTSVVRFIPAELMAAFRYFDASGYTPWMGVAVSMLAAEALLYSAWRRTSVGYSYSGLAVSLWGLALALSAWEAAPGVWLLTCAAASLATYGLGRWLASREIFGPPLEQVSRALAWIGVAAAAVTAAALATDHQMRWFTAVGVVLLLVRFAIEALERRGMVEALPIPGLALLAAAWALRAVGTPWEYTDAVLALMLVAAPFAAAMLGDERRETRRGLEYSAAGLALVLVVPALHFADAPASEAHRAIPLFVAAALALLSCGWALENTAARISLFGVAGLMVETAAWRVFSAAEWRDLVNERYRTFWLAPAAYAFLAVWFALRRFASDRLRDLGVAARLWASLAAGIAAATAVTLLLDGAANNTANFAFAAAVAITAVVPVAIAIVERDGIAPTIEGCYGVLLALAAYGGLVGAVANEVPSDYRGFTALVMLGLAPLLLAGVEHAVGDRAPALSRPAGVIGSVVAVLAMFWLLEIPRSSFVAPDMYSTVDRASFVTLAFLLAAYGYRCVVFYKNEVAHAFWTLQATVSVLLGVHGILRMAHSIAPVALVSVAVGCALLVAGLRALARGARLGPAAVAAGHGLIALAVADLLAAQHPSQPVSWGFVAVVGAAALSYAIAAATCEGGSTLERIHRGLAAVAGFATASAALHAMGLTTISKQAEPLALLLAVAMLVLIAVPSEWARRDGVWIAHVLMIGLVVAAIGDGAILWTSIDVARFTATVCVFYAVAMLRGDAISLAASIFWGCISIAALSTYLHLDRPIEATIFAGIGAALVAVSEKLPERVLWARRVSETAGHIVFWLALAFEVVLLLPNLYLANPALSRHVAAFAAMTAFAWILGRVGGERQVVYGILWKPLAITAYTLLGLRLGYHPWHDSVYYTLPTGILLLAIGAVASRDEDRAEAPILLWLGSLLAAVPMLLHALDNRFVQDTSPVGYDMGTLGVGVAIAFFGVLLQLRAPALVGTVVLAIDIFVIVFGKITWNQRTLAAFGLLLGGMMIAISWLILYRREDLYRIRDFLLARRDAFRSWR